MIRTNKTEKQPMHNPQYWINHLKLVKHPEGGYYRETYRSGLTFPNPHATVVSNNRAVSTAIYFLLPGNECSALHRIKSDELWHFYTGSTITIHCIAPNGATTAIALGDNPDYGEAFQAMIPAGTWFGAAVDDPASFALVGCTVAPGFDFADFELGDRKDLLRAYPHCRDLIVRLTIE